MDHSAWRGLLLLPLFWANTFVLVAEYFYSVVFVLLLKYSEYFFHHCLVSFIGIYTVLSIQTIKPVQPVHRNLSDDLIGSFPLRHDVSFLVKGRKQQQQPPPPKDASLSGEIPQHVIIINLMWRQTDVTGCVLLYKWRGGQWQEYENTGNAHSDTLAS